MSFSVPTFNLNVNIWRNSSGPPNPPDVTSVCNLAYGRRVSMAQGIEGAPPNLLMSLLLPPGADVQSAICSGSADWVEVPAGSGRIYEVLDVDDIGKGFSNEHRIAILLASTFFGFWPAPIP